MIAGCCACGGTFSLYIVQCIWFLNKTMKSGELVIKGVQRTRLRSGPGAQAKGEGGQDRRVSSSVSPTHSPEQSGAGLSAGAHADLLKLPAVRHRGDHLGQLLLLALQHSVNMLGGHLLRDERGRGGGVTEAGRVIVKARNTKGKYKHTLLIIDVT